METSKLLYKKIEEANLTCIAKMLYPGKRKLILKNTIKEERKNEKNNN